MSRRAAHPPESSDPLVIWLISDGKPGHVNQALGLSRAIESRIATETHRILAPAPIRSWFDYLRRGTTLGRDLPDPELIIGAGHRTHPALLAARAVRGGRSIVLMRPTLPTALFDLAIIPQHDLTGQRAEKTSVIVTRGVLNSMRPAANPQPDRGLILLGGPSRHVKWSDESIVSQVEHIAADDRDLRWNLTTSRRTPETLTERLDRCELPNVTVTPFAQTAPGWVAEHLDLCSRVWVSADSVSMVYEALTAGAAVGVLEVEQRRAGRVNAGLQELMREGFVTSYLTWEGTRRLEPPPTRLNEADRCAEFIIDHWFADRLVPSRTADTPHEGADV